MADVEEYAAKLTEVSKAIREASEKARDLCGWPIEQLVESYLSMFERFCPFRVGDRVKLRATPDLTDAPGWKGSKHWLVAGAAGIVRARGYTGGAFSFDVEFDDESWKDDAGVVRPTSCKHTYGFREHFLLPAE